MAKRFPPVHPGEILIEEFLRPMGIGQYRLAKDIRVPPRRINEIVHPPFEDAAGEALREHGEGRRTSFTRGGCPQSCPSLAGVVRGPERLPCRG